MLFLHPWLLAGLAAAAIPVIIHLVRRQAAKPVAWGAMRFLFDTVSVRRRKMEWEDLVLMAARCLLLALVALALARPFVPPDSRVPWSFVLPAALLGIAGLGGSFVLGKTGVRWLVRTLAAALLLAAAGLVLLEKYLNLKRFEAAGGHDVALVIDASASMTVAGGGRTRFQSAVEEAKRLVNDAPAGTAFSVILGGPAPEARTAAPLNHRADVLGILDRLEPPGGTFRAHDALGMATLGLAEGTGASKEIVVFTDPQRSGWRLDNPAAWDDLAAAWKALPSRPKLLLRDFGAPPAFRNVSVASLELSRPLVGTDREVTLRVTVENTGAESVTSGPVVIETGGAKAGQAPVGLLAPGQRQTVEIRHRFTRPGPQAVEAAVDLTDDLAADNRLARVVAVRATLPVLLVDGNPAGNFLARAAGYTALALAPSTALLGGAPAAGRFLMDPRVVAAPALTAADLEGAAVIVLADVSRLPEKPAARLAAMVADGAGLLVIAGPRADPAFYNAWQSRDGPLLPLPLGEEITDAAGISPAAATFGHESLQLFAKSGDLETARVHRWRKTGGGDPAAAAFSNGDAFLAARACGRGRCVLATCAFDARSGNLPARKSFVPLVHELVAWAAGGGPELNVDAAWSPGFALDSGGGGLSATYFRGHKRREGQPVERVDPAIDFDWRKSPPFPDFPRDNYSARWTGSLVPPASGSYLFDAEADDRLEMTLATRVFQADYNRRELGHIDLQAGKAEPLEISFEQDGGEAYARLFWTPPGGKRQLVPTSALLPAAPARAVALQAVDPRGMPRAASIRTGRHGRELAIDGPAVPGIYQVTAGAALDSAVPGIRDGKLPVAVGRDAAESRFEPRTEEDLSLVRKRVDLLQPRSAADLLAVLQGKGFGREIHKLLALSAFVLFLLESVLARWVSKSRRTAEDLRVDFGGAAVWKSGR